MTEPTPPPQPVNTAGSDEAGVAESSGSGNKPPSPTKRPAPSSSAPALASPSSTPLQPIMEARPRLSSVAGIEEGDEDEENEGEGEGEAEAGLPPLGAPVTGGSVAAAFSPVVRVV